MNSFLSGYIPSIAQDVLLLIPMFNSDIAIAKMAGYVVIHIAS